MKIKVDLLPKTFNDCLFGMTNGFGKPICKFANGFCKCVLLDNEDNERFEPVLCPYLDSSPNLI